jgi:hypothetical protein
VAVAVVVVPVALPAALAPAAALPPSKGPKAAALAGPRSRLALSLVARVL